MDKSKLKQMLSPEFYVLHIKRYRNMIKKDEIFNATFRCGKPKLRLKDKRAYKREWAAVKLCRKYQANHDTIWGCYYRRRLFKFSCKTGIDLGANKNFGEGLLIGHWGRIVVNGDAKFGNEIMLTHGVTIGRDIRGKRAGVPTIGNRVCIRTNSTIVGNVTIGDDVIIAPNTFVNFDVPPHSIVIGNPATIHHRDNATEGHLGRLYE